MTGADAELPGNSMVNTAKRELRRHIDADWIHARGMVEQHPDERRSRHRSKRPLTVAVFVQKWPDTVLTRRGDKIYYRSSLLPKGHTGDGGSGVNAGVDGDGENGKDGDSGSGAGGANGGHGGSDGGGSDGGSDDGEDGDDGGSGGDADGRGASGGGTGDEDDEDGEER